LPLLKQQGARILFECPPALAPLAGDLLHKDELVLSGSGQRPPYDVHCGLLSLPRVFGVLPASSPYLSVDPNRAEAWRQQLSDVSGMRVGLLWAGNPQNSRDRQRSIRAQLFQLLRETPGAALFSLQRARTKSGFPTLTDRSINLPTPRP